MSFHIHDKKKKILISISNKFPIYFPVYIFLHRFRLFFTLIHLFYDSIFSIHYAISNKSSDLSLKIFYL